MVLLRNRPEDLGPFVEGEVGGDQDGPAFVALAEDLEEQFRPGGGQGDEPQLIDDQQVEWNSFRWRLSSRLASLAPTGPLYLVFIGAMPSAVTQPVYFAAMALLDRPPCRKIAESGSLARASPSRPALAGNSPVYGPGWEFPHVVAQGVAGKPGLFLPGRTVYFCPFQPGVQQDDALRDLPLWTPRNGVFRRNTVGGSALWKSRNPGARRSITSGKRSP